MANSTTSPQTVSSVSLKTKTNNVTVTYIFSMFQSNGLCLIWVDFPLFWLAAGFHFLVLVLWYLVEINSNKAPPWTLFFSCKGYKEEPEGIQGCITRVDTDWYLFKAFYLALASFSPDAVIHLGLFHDPFFIFTF